MRLVLVVRQDLFHQFLICRQLYIKLHRLQTASILIKHDTNFRHVSSGWYFAENGIILPAPRSGDLLIN